MSTGEPVQIDTLIVNTRRNKPIKHFNAHDPVTKWMVTRVCPQVKRSQRQVAARQALEQRAVPDPQHSGRRRQ
jgi:hypothetical protein